MTDSERTQTASDARRSRARGESTPIYDTLAGESERRVFEQQEAEG